MIRYDDVEADIDRFVERVAYGLGRWWKRLTRKDPS